MISAILERLESLHRDLDQVVAGLPVEALDWTPGEGMNSIAVLAAHVAGSERFWVGELAGGDPAGRMREAEFETRGVSEAQLRALLDGSLEHSRGVLSRLDEGGLGALRYNPFWEREISVAVCLAHVLEHTGTHLGHMQATRDLWERRRP
jgi:uncharacterized damage-inducible protein DinB